MPDLRRPARTAGLAIIVGLVLAGCSSADPVPAVEQTGLAATVSELCLAANDTDLTAAVERFQTVHGPLHDVADQASDVDRTIAAQLLRAKQQVEAGITDGLGDDEMHVRLTSLAEAATSALASLDIAAPPTCTPIQEQP